MKVVRQVIGWIIIIFGYFTFFMALEVLFDSTAAKEEALWYYLLADLLIFAGSLIVGVHGWKKPTGTSVIGTFVVWIIYLALLPFVFFIRTFISFIKWFFYGLFHGFGSGESDDESDDVSYSGAQGGEKLFIQEIKKIASSACGSSSVSTATRVERYVSTSILSHSATLTVKYRFSVNDRLVGADEEECIRNYIESFNKTLYNRVLNAGNALAERYDDVGNWGIRVESSVEVR